MRYTILAGVIIVALVGMLFLVKVTKTPTIPETPIIVPQTEEPEKGALVGVSMKSKVAVLLDEIPESMRERTTLTLVSKPESFWKERAKRQAKLATYRLVFRDAYYGDSEEKHALEKPKQALPLPPDSVWNIQLGKPRRETIEGHDVVVADYELTSVILTDRESPGISEPNLAIVGGSWEEPFVFPLDPELLFQRTRFACMDEAEFPHFSVDAEDVETFYDQECEVEEELSRDGCHQTELPEMSCVEALTAKTGKIETSIVFVRLPWDSRIADQVRVGEITNPTGADLQSYKEQFHVNRISYRYIPPDSCTLVEKCVGAPGWRRLLQFGAADKNTGTKTLDIGEVDYFVEGTGTKLSEMGIFEHNECHDHFHFPYYGSFTYGGKVVNQKYGFCLQSTNRVNNLEISPLYNPYAGCGHQGVEVGWVDEYTAGIECQWVDVTDFDTTQKPFTGKLEFISNPHGFLCEGTPLVNAQGNQQYELTEFKTADGKPVYRPKCRLFEGWFDNNVDSYEITLPLTGEGYVTAPCSKGEIGPLRNCGFKMQTKIATCTPGKEVRLKCSANGAVVRICDYSKALQTGIPCTYNGPHNALSLANEIVEKQAEITFTCPTARDEKETGGAYSIYTAPILPEDQAQNVICTPA
jgi:hypothetical protein